MTLQEFFATHFELERLAGKRPETRRAHVRAIERFRSFLDREPLLEDLNAKTCDAFEGWLAENGFAVRSGLDGRRCIVSIWRFAYQTGIVLDSPAGKRNLKRVSPCPAVAFLTDTPRESSILVDFVRQYAIERGLAARSAGQLRFIINSFGRSLKHRPRLTDLRDETVNRLIIELQESGIAPETVRGRRTALLGVWRHAVDAELDGVLPPKRIRKVKVPAKAPRCWSQEQVKALLLAADKAIGRHLGTGLAYSLFWRAWILIGYHSGLRRDDLLSLHFSDITTKGIMVVTQSKTGNLVKKHLPPEAMAAMKAIENPLRRCIFGSVLSAARIRKGFAKVVKAARLEGSTKTLRKTGATWCEAQAPGSAMRFLGHRTPGLAYQCYVDPRYIQDSPAGPQEIGGDA